MTVHHSIAGIARKGDLYLIAKRKEGGALSEKWEFPGGKLKRGESHEAAVAREWGEEFGVAVKVGNFLCSGSFFHKGKNFLLSAYEVFPLSEDFALIEHTEIRWVPMAVLETMDMAESDLKLLDGLRRKS